MLFFNMASRSSRVVKNIGSTDLILNGSMIVFMMIIKMEKYSWLTVAMQPGSGGFFNDIFPE